MRAFLLLSFVLAASAACRYPDADDRFDLVAKADADSDGFEADLDCDDTDPAVHPGAAELCNDVDDDCNELVDDDPTDLQTFWADADDDGFGDPASATGACEAPADHVAQGDDCDDDDPSRNPGMAELADDGIDQDCSGTDTVACHPDADQDGHGAAGGSVVLAPDGSCDLAQKESEVADDCDDDDPSIHPGTVEVPGDGIDQDCFNGDAPPCYTDGDGDGIGDILSPVVDEACDGDLVSPTPGDCDDTDGTVLPLAPELCDGQLNDCDGSLLPEEVDGDGDGYVTCTVDAGGWDGPSTLQGGDCDDTRATVFPGNTTELCDGLQNDCEAWAGPGDPGTLPADETDPDEDGYVACTFASGVTPGTWGQAAVPPIAGDEDCAPADGAVSPGAPEICDGKANVCGSPLPSGELDDDDDGFVECTFAGGVDEETWGNAESPAVEGGGDCADDDVQRHPGAAELCDGLDDDCDGSLADEDGQVSHESPAGAWTDITSVLVTAGRSSVIDTPGTTGTVWFCRGTYHTTLDLDSFDGLTLEGRHGKDETTLSGRDPADGEPDARIAAIGGTGSVVFRGLTLDGGLSGGVGGAVRISGTPTVTFEDCDLTDHTSAEMGGAIHLAGGTLTLEDTSVTRGFASKSGGGIYVADGDVTLSRALVHDNTADGNGSADGGGGLYLAAGALTLDDATVSSNVGQRGGGLYVLAGTVDVAGSTFDGNTAEISGGGVFQADGTLTVRAASFFQANEAEGGSDQGGGAIAVSDGTVTVQASTLTDNHATGNDGGAIAVLYDGGNEVIAVDLEDAVLSHNTAFDWGGAIACHEDCTITMTDSSLLENTADEGGAVFLANPATLACTATTAGAARIVGNSALNAEANPAIDPAGGVQVNNDGSTVTSDGCDWGTGADENTPYDFTGPNASVNDLGADEDVTCDENGCS